MTSKHIDLNGPAFEVMPKADEPLRLTQTFATTTSQTGEKIEILTAAANPQVFVLRGEKLTGVIDMGRVLQEALIHVLRENA